MNHTSHRINSNGVFAGWNLTIVALLSAFVLAGSAGAATRQRGGIDNAAVSRLRALFASEWQRDLRDDPKFATDQGDSRYNDLWQDLSLAAIAARQRANSEVLNKLHAIARIALPPDEQLNYDLFEREYRNRVRVAAFKPELYQINHQGGIQTLSETAETLPFQTVKDYDDWNARLGKIGTLIDQHIELLRVAAREHRTQPRVIMQRVAPQLDAQIVTSAEDSPFFEPLKRMPSSFSAAERERIVQTARRAIADSVVPGYQRLRKVFVDEYLPATRESVGINDTPNGAEFYRERIAFHTTSATLTADQIHDIGLAEVARIRAEMAAVIQQVGFTGSYADFLQQLRTDPKFYYKTPQELLDAYAVIAKRIDPNLPKLFRVLPRIPYGVRPIPRTSAPNTTTAYYQPPASDGTRPGYFYVNLYKPEVRPKYEMEVLTSHEAVPGHHLQIALALELSALPEFRRNAGYTAFVEGWALYSERLGSELGLYTDPYSKFGQLTYDMWRACRLVVDTGMHAKGWTRQQAVDFMQTNTAKTATDINNEIDRYISWPGQALAYKIGQLKILTLRQAAEQQLGARFDIREFHNAVLSNGAIPLDLLETNVRHWVTSVAAHKSTSDRSTAVTRQ